MNTTGHSFISVKVQARARKTGIERLGPAEFRVKVSAPPVKGAANREVIEMIARHFNVPRAAVKIVQGKTSSRKRIAIVHPTS